MTDINCMFLHRSTPTTTADKALVKDGCFEFNHLQIIAVHMRRRAGAHGGVMCLCVPCETERK